MKFLLAVLLALTAAACTSPIGADQSPCALGYHRVEASGVGSCVPR